MLFYHYASDTIKRLVDASVPQCVPNFDRLGKPRDVYITDSLYGSIAAAEAALQIGAMHPAGAMSPPSWRFDLDLTGCTYTNRGRVKGGTATEFTTRDAPLVTGTTKMGP